MHMHTCMYVHAYALYMHCIAHALYALHQVMLVLLEATFEQLGAARSRVLGETTAEQLQALDTTLHCTHTLHPHC